MSRSWQLSRRTFLRGAGAALSLPWLDAMSDASGATRQAAAGAAGSAGAGGAAAAVAAGKPPVRVGFLFFPNGVWKDTWFPKQPGKDFDLPYALEPLADHKRDITVLSGLDKAHSHGGDGHYAKTANWLTGLDVAKTTGKEINVGGVSLDQHVAQKIGRFTPLPSMELGIDPVVSGVDSLVGYTRLYASYIAWRSPREPVAKEINPRLAYQRLFGAKDASGKPVGGGQARDDRRSLLDAALGDAKDVRAKLGRDDQFKLDEYLDSVRSVETRLAHFDQVGTDGGPAAALRWKPPTSPGEVKLPPHEPPADYREHVRLMLDLIVLGFWTDSTRVSSFMFANCVSGRNFSFVDGVKGGHHDTSHHSNKAEKIEQYKRINRWHASQLAYLLGKMKAVKEGEGTLLDNSMLMFGSSMGDGNAHEPRNLPIILAGRAGGALESGRYLASPKDTPLCNVYVSMLQKMGLPADRFGDSTGPLAGL
jgi:hypothetical protein